MSMRWTVVVVNVERPNPILPDLIGGVLVSTQFYRI